MRQFGLAIGALAFGLCASIEAGAQTTPSPTKEQPGIGSNASGMAPQQGTGSGLTSTPAEQAPSGPPSGADNRLNREYGRETSAEGQPLHQSNPGKPN